MARHHETKHRRRPSTPFLLDVIGLGRRPGAMMTIRERVISPTRIGLDLVTIPAGGDVELDLQLQSVSEGVLVIGTVAGATTGECVRCLAPVTGHIEVQLTELFAYPDSATDTTTDGDELGRVVDDTVDLEQVVVDAIGLALPLAPLCRPDCPGLCPDCGVALADAGPDHRHEVIDPRWAKLAGLVEPAEPGETPR